MAHQSTRTNDEAKAPKDTSGKHQSASKALAYFAATANPASQYISPYAPSTNSEAPQPQRASPATAYTTINSSLKEASLEGESSQLAYNSAYSSSSPDSSIYSSASGKMSSHKISANEKAQLIRSLQTHKVNTLTELRRIEKIFASLNSADLTEPMSNAWAHYVNSNNLLSELRGLTKNYPFSSECLDEAKSQVIGDPNSTRSWNYCWLVLAKIRKEGLIAKHARLLAVKPAMWGGRTPTSAGVEKLATACVGEWTRALDQMLRHWSSPPSVVGR